MSRSILCCTDANPFMNRVLGNNPSEDTEFHLSQSHICSFDADPYNASRRETYTLATGELLMQAIVTLATGRSRRITTWDR